MQPVSGVTRDNKVAQFVKWHLPPVTRVLHCLRCWSSAKLSTTLRGVSPPALADQWLPWVQYRDWQPQCIFAGNYHGTSSRYLQEYFNEFCYRFNRREWEAQLPLREYILTSKFGNQNASW
jgi:hypothetical protein